MLHRLIALGGGLALILMSWIWLRNRHGYNVLASGIVAMIFLEIGIGILNAVFRVPVPVSALHTAIAATLTGLLFYLLADAHLKKEIL
jgi:heme A synthase